MILHEVGNRRERGANGQAGYNQRSKRRGKGNGGRRRSIQRRRKDRKQYRTDPNQKGRQYFGVLHEKLNHRNQRFPERQKKIAKGRERDR
ncbi:hypothetical protein D3C76_1423290 [compost metagenome]